MTRVKFLRRVMKVTRATVATFHHSWPSWMAKFLSFPLRVFQHYKVSLQGFYESTTVPWAQMSLGLIRTVAQHRTKQRLRSFSKVSCHLQDIQNVCLITEYCFNCCTLYTIEMVLLNEIQIKKYQWYQSNLIWVFYKLGLQCWLNFSNPQKCPVWLNGPPNN